MSADRPQAGMPAERRDDGEAEREARAPKTCVSCGVTKPRSAFWPRKDSKDGRERQCAQCRYKIEAARRKSPAERDRRLVAARERRARNPEAAERDRERWRRKARKNAGRYIIPMHEQARRELRRAVLSGRVTKPTACQICGGGGRIHGHHHDYSKPLEVEWLCPRCHGATHRREVSV